MAGGFTQSALACGAGLCPPSGDGGSVSQSGQSVTVQVSGTLVSGGSSGSGGSSSTTVSVPTPCYYWKVWSGKEYYDGVKNGTIGQPNQADRDAKPVEGYEQHKDEDGAYWSPVCESTTFGDDLDGFFKYAEEWFKGRKTMWVPAGQQPPTPPVPPTVLRDAALKVMTLPEPTFDWNPKANGGESVVNLDTWFWLDDNVASGDVTATAGGNSVTVTAQRESVTFSAPTAGAVDCADGGTAWAPGAHSDCVLYYRQASSGTPTTAHAHWGLTWSFNGQPQGALDPMDAEQTENIGVFEVQTINRAG
jgi:hypothetical protein